MNEFDVVIVGAGLSGIGAACRMQIECPTMSYAVLEARGTLGGTWDLFRFPGVRSDTDAFTMSYSFRPWDGPKTAATSGAELLDYIRTSATEYGVDKHIRYSTRVLGASWSSQTARWTVRAEQAGEAVEFRCRFLYTCTGYFSYSTPHQPDFAGIADYTGELIHPQFWRNDVAVAGKRVVVIGSGATAATVVPALARTAEHVTMLQRSPSYMFALPEVDALAVGLSRVLPGKVAHRVVWGKNVAMQFGLWELARRRPETFKRLCRKVTLHCLKDPAYVDAHFTPSYQPWDERLCFVPGGDLFTAIRSGKASVVTDHVDRFVADGIRLRSGQVLAADVVVAATGLTLHPLGGLALDVDGAPVEVSEKLAYRSMMLSDVPNLAFCFGYANYSWTLGADLSSRYVCKLLRLLKDGGHDFAVPTPPAGQEPRPFIPLKSGYVRRGIGDFPAAGTTGPWAARVNYPRDRIDARRADLTKDMTFGSRERTLAAVPN